MNKNKLLKLLETNARLTSAQLAKQLSVSEQQVADAIIRLEQEKIILGYSALIDWERTKREYVSAIIELKVTPLHGEGFDKVANRIKTYPEVKSIFLMSGGYDITLTIEGKTLKEIALFVARKLAPMQGVISTATHFVLKKYKDEGIVFDTAAGDERDIFSV